MPKQHPPQSAKLILTTPEHFIAWGFGAGLAPKAPGTFGTLVGLPFFFLFRVHPVAEYLLICALMFGFGCLICDRSAKLLGVHDHGGIVFDEIVGFLVTCTPLIVLGGSLWWLLPAFVLFRIFDIVKPWPIRVVDAKVHGGFGIMVDDLIAAVFAAAFLWGLMAAFG